VVDLSIPVRPTPGSNPRWWDLWTKKNRFWSAGRSIDGPADFQNYAAYQVTFDNDDFRGSNSSMLPEAFAMTPPGK